MKRVCWLMISLAGWLGLASGSVLAADDDLLRSVPLTDASRQQDVSAPPVARSQPNAKPAPAPHATQAEDAKYRPAFIQPPPMTLRPWRFPVKLCYLNSFREIVDWHEKNTSSKENTATIPIGIAASPYYRFESGLFIWGGIGPVSAILGNVSYWNVPIGAGAGFFILPAASVSPYAKLGARFPIAGGDYVDSKSPGIVASAGVEVMHTKRVSIVVEVGYDTSSVSFKPKSSIKGASSEDIAGGLLVEVGAVF